MNGRLRDAVAALDDYRADKAQQQPDLFTILEQVVETAGEVYRQETLQAIYELAQRRPTFTVEHVQPLAAPCHDRRAIGGLLVEANKRGWINKGGWVSSGAERHGRPVREWHSLLYRGDTDDAA